MIENFRPGVMERLGLGPADMTTRNPRLIYLSLPGFFSTEREKACIRAFEGIIGEATGLFTDLHIIRRALEAPPVYTPVPVASAYAAIHGALAVSLALYAREETGRGDVIEVPLAGAAMSAMGAILQRAPDHAGMVARARAGSSGFDGHSGRSGLRGNATVRCPDHAFKNAWGMVLTEAIQPWRARCNSERREPFV